MDFALTEEQQILKQTARDFLAKECPKKLVREMAEDERGYSCQLWQRMAELGWLGLVFPTQYGGEGASFLDLVILMEEMGRALLPSPFLATVVLGGLSILEAGSKEQKAEFLPKIANGTTLLTLALTETSAKYDASSIIVKAIPNHGVYTISGTKLFVPNAHVADYLVCVTRTQNAAKSEEGITDFIVDARSPGVTCTPLKSIDQNKQSEVVFENVIVPARNILGRLDNGWTHIERVLQKATVALCAEMIGGTEQVIDMTVNYAKERKQFEQPIGSFQIIQHLCVDMLIALEASRVITYEAAWKISQGLPCKLEVSMAKSQISNCYKQATRIGTQIHGGVAYMADHDMPLYYKRAKAVEAVLGDADIHREMIARELLD